MEALGHWLQWLQWTRRPCCFILKIINMMKILDMSDIVDMLDRAFSSIEAIGANGLGPPPNGGLQILHIWSILQLCAHFDTPFHIIFQISTFY